MMFAWTWKWRPPWAEIWQPRRSARRVPGPERLQISRGGDCRGSSPVFRRYWPISAHHAEPPQRVGGLLQGRVERRRPAQVGDRGIPCAELFLDETAEADGLRPVWVEFGGPGGVGQRLAEAAGHVVRLRAF